MRAGRDIEEDHLIGTLIIIPDGELHGITHIAQLSGLGPTKLNATGDFSSVDIQTGYDALGEMTSTHRIQ